MPQSFTILEKDWGIPILNPKEWFSIVIILLGKQ